jgi:hypothetical protein
MAMQAQERRGIACPQSPQQFAGLFLLLFQIQDSLLRVPGPHDRRKRVNETSSSKPNQVGAALSADGTRPARV